MSLVLALPVLLGAIFLVLIALTTVYRRRPHDIDNVILAARKLDLSDLETLLDASSEWNLRRSLPEWALQKAQEDRIRLGREYLRRVAFNAELIHLWILQEHERIEGKKREEYTEIDLLIVEALQLATNLRLYSIAGSLRIFVWMALKAYRWPIRFLPRMTDLRVRCGVNVLQEYRRLTEIALLVSSRCGETYRERLFEAL
jgi:hypothetical protein